MGLFSSIKTIQPAYEISIKQKLDLQAEKNIYYYKQNHIGILSHLESHLTSIITNETLLKWMPRIYVNDIPRFANKLCMLYKDKADRKFKGNEKNIELFEKGLNRSFKEFHRRAKVQNTILVRPVFSDGKFNFITIDRSRATVITDENDYNKMNEMFYLRQIRIGEELITARFHWDDTDFWVTDEDNKEIKKLPESIASQIGAHGYGKNPFIVLRLSDGFDDFWGDGMPDVVNANEIISGKLCDTFAKQWMSFGYGIAVNLDKKAKDIEYSPYKLASVNEHRADMTTPDIKFVTPDHQVLEDRELTDWMRKVIGNAQGMSAAAMSEVTTEMSGYRAMLDNIELIDQNNDDRDVMIDFEYELNEMMNKEYEITGNGKGAVLESVSLKPYEFPKSEEEIWFNRDKEKENNMSSPADWIKEDNPDLTDAEVNEIIAKSKAVNSQLKETSLSQRINQRVNGTA